MLEKLSKRIVGWQIKKGVLQQAECATYEYAYELLLNQMINILIAVGLVALYKAPDTVIVFLICYIPLRSYCGGYHADTNFACTVVSALMIAFVCFLTEAIAGRRIEVFYPSVFLLSGYFVLRYVPVEDHNKPLDEAEIKRYSMRGRILWAVEAVGGVILFFSKRKVGIVIAITHIVLSGVLWSGIRKNKKRKQKS